MAEERTIADIAADIAANDAEVAALNKEVKEIQAQTRILDDELKVAAEKQKLTAGKTSKYTWDISPKTMPQSDGDWPGFYAFMAENGFWSLLQQRLSIKGCEELWDKGIVIPGVAKFTELKVKVKEIK